MMRASGYHDLREEILEHLWCLEEAGGEATLPALLTEVGGTNGAAHPDDAAIGAELERATAAGMVLRNGEALRLTPEGHRAATHVVRANRLAQRLLADILELPAGLAEPQACRLEHAISPALADHLCTFLGHPPTAPDGRPIPRGRCCTDPRAVAGPAIRPLPEMDVGSHGRVTFIRPRHDVRIDQLSALGLMPGVTVRLRQRRPAVVVELDESTLALDADVARDIYVKPA